MRWSIHLVFLPWNDCWSGRRRMLGRLRWMGFGLGMSIWKVSPDSILDFAYSINHGAHANTYSSQPDNSHLPPISPDSSAHLHIPNHLRRIRWSPFHDLSIPNPVTRRTSAGLPNRSNTPTPSNILHAASPTSENHRLRPEAHYLRQLREH